jgi:rubredoxin
VSNKGREWKPGDGYPLPPFDWPLAWCPACGVERADFEGAGLHLPTCPNCGSDQDPTEAKPLG